MATLIKLSDDIFEGVHPNGINAGFKETAEYTHNPIIGESYKFGSLTTSNVTEVVHSNSLSIQFKTNNSTYKIIK